MLIDFDMECLEQDIRDARESSYLLARTFLDHFVNYAEPVDGRVIVFDNEKYNIHALGFRCQFFESILPNVLRRIKNKLIDPDKEDRENVYTYHVLELIFFKLHDRSFFMDFVNDMTSMLINEDFRRYATIMPIEEFKIET